ncbi:MAG: glutathione synthase [Gammaproteobacteria bacterium]|nr:glutathione synthase [Gammaproteobacteria bacterium]
MTIKLAVVMDPIRDISFKKDTTLAMLNAAQQRGWELIYIEQRGLYLEDGKAMAIMQDLSVKMDPDDWYTLGPEQRQSLSTVDVILMRKDPPFNREYIYSTYMLEQAEREGVLVVNKPQALRDFNEKVSATLFPQCCTPVLVTQDKDLLMEFHNTHGDVIFKPLDGMGGTGIFRLKLSEPNVSVIIETLTEYGTRQIMAQTFIPEISTSGDKRILMINGESIGYALARLPAKNETRGNLAAGGTAKGVELSDRDRWICEQVGPTLKENGLLFVGIDVIGDYMTEINVTSPTCVRELDEAFNLDISGQLMDCIDEKLKTDK